MKRVTLKKREMSYAPVPAHGEVPEMEESTSGQ